MRWQPAAVCTFLAILVVAPAHAADEQTSSDRSRPFSVHLGLGSQLKDGGDVQSLSFGYTMRRAFTLLVNVERNHVPTRARTYADRYSVTYSVTRGGTLTSISGEFRYTVPLGERLSPVAVVGRGAGISHPNVNDIFPRRVTHVVDVFYAGGGMRVPLRPRFDVFVDARFVIFAGKRNVDVLGAMLPIRAGVTWRF